MSTEDLPVILDDPTGGELPQTEFPPDEFPDPTQDPNVEVGGDQE